MIMRTRPRSQMLFVGLGVAAILDARIVLAADATPGETASGELEEVTVTAERRESSLQKTALSITAISADQIEETHQRLDGIELRLPATGILACTATPVTSVMCGCADGPFLPEFFEHPNTVVVHVCTTCCPTTRYRPSANRNGISLHRRRRECG